MNYRQIPPSPAVAQFVEFYWTLEDNSHASFVQRIVPDGRSGIILNFANPFESLTNGSWRLQPQRFFVGQITGPLLLRPSGPAAMLGIQFHANGAARLLPGNMPLQPGNRCSITGLLALAPSAAEIMEVLPFRRP
jgi:hypothetical protein